MKRYLTTLEGKPHRKIELVEEGDDSSNEPGLTFAPSERLGTAMLFRCVFVLCFLLFSTSAQAEEDRLLYRFSFVGCNRVGFEVDPVLNPSTANVEQLRNTFREVARATPKPSHLFLVGDLILGYTGYLSTVDQLQAWKRLYERSELKGSGVEMVPIVGNHEMLLSHQNATTKLWRDAPNPIAAKAWREVMKPLLKWRDGPTPNPPNLDSLTDTQEDLSFTVRDRGVLFVVLNTDTFIDNVTVGDIPLHWLEEQLLAAEQDDTISDVFVLGHKPLLKPDLEAAIIREPEIEPALKLLNASTKVRAFLAAHYHLWDMRPLPGGIPQVIAGNGGSPLKGPFIDPEVGYFGYTIVDLMESGKIVVESWGRPVPEPYSSDEPQPPATLRERRVIEPRRTF